MTQNEGKGGNKKETIQELVAKIKARKNKRPKPHELKSYREDRDRYGNRYTIAGSIAETPVQYRNFSSSKSPRLASLDSQQVRAYTNPGYKNKDAASSMPGRYNVTQYDDLKSFSPRRQSPRHKKNVAFGAQATRFAKERRDPEPTYRAINNDSNWNKGVSFPQLPRFRKGFGERDLSRGIHGDGAIDQMYDIERNISMARALENSPLKYSGMRAAIPRFATPRANLLRQTMTPQIKSAAVADTGPGFYNPPSGLRDGQGEKRSHMFNSTTPRFSVPRWGKNTPASLLVFQRDHSDPDYGH